MNATPSTLEPVSAGNAPVSPPEIDASCRVPLFMLFVSAAVWLVIAAAFALIASIKFHAPDFLADVPELTYGRVHAAAAGALLYGFAVQAGLGVALVIFARLGQARVAQPWLIAVGAMLWNLGATVGVAGILAGDSTGFENLEMPRYAAVVLFLGYLIIGLWTVLTLKRRRARPLVPPQWFLLAALFWFPWIYSTANLLLLVFPVRGVDQAVIDWWFSANLNLVWLGLVGLAAVFYFIPQLTGRVLHSEFLALFTFWTLILFASWSGIPASAPVPAWMPVLSTVATVLTLIPLLTVALNVYQTLGGRCSRLKANPSSLFIGFGVVAFVISWAMNIVGALPGVSPVTAFTWFKVAQAQLNAYGFFAMTMFGAIYYIVPQVTGVEWPFAKLVRAHFWCAAVGVVLFAVPLAIGGIIQGLDLNDPDHVAFLDVAKATLPFLRASTLGDTLLALGHVFLLANLAALSVRYYRAHFVPAYESVTAPIKPAEVKP